jgi:hypothetical protein
MNATLPYEQLFIKQHSDSLISYKGPINPEVISVIISQLRENISTIDQLTTRLAAISIELTQNMQYYSSELINFGKRKERVGWIQVFEKEDGYEVNCGNVLRKEVGNQLKQHCNTIRQLDKDDLRSLKRERRKKKLSEDQQGAGIGLIQVTILAGSAPEIDIIDINNDLSCVIFKINIKK